MRRAYAAGGTGAIERGGPPRPALPPTRAARPIIPVFVVALVLSAIWIGILVYAAAQHGPTSRRAFVTDYDGRVLDDGLELLIVQSDGQAYATLARDPLLRRAETSFRTAGEASYRAQRPLLGWLAWAGSLGRSGWVPPALATVSALGAALAAAGIGALLQLRGRSAWWGLAILLLPGTALSLSFLGPEPLVLGLLAWGLVAWERKRPGVATALLTLAALGRESAILVPLTLGAMALLGRDRRRLANVALVPVGLAAWYVALRVRVGAWPWEVTEGRIGPPLRGFIDGTALWADPAVEAMIVALGVLITVAAVAVARQDLLARIVVVHVAFALIMGRYVWSEALGHGRVLLPLHALGIVAIAGGLSVSRDGFQARGERGDDSS